MWSWDCVSQVFIKQITSNINEETWSYEMTNSSHKLDIVPGKLDLTVVSSRLGNASTQVDPSWLDTTPCATFAPGINGESFLRLQMKSWWKNGLAPQFWWSSDGIGSLSDSIVCFPYSWVTVVMGASVKIGRSSSVVSGGVLPHSSRGAWAQVKRFLISPRSRLGNSIVVLSGLFPSMPYDSAEFMVY